MSKTVQNTLDWVSPIVRYMPLASGTNSEPAVTNANMVQQTIVGAPFCWPWNRATLTFPTVIGQQDYTQSAATFGFIEKATVTDALGNVKELTDKAVLSLDSRPGRPEHIAAQSDDGAGNISFRLMKVPDAVYTVNIIYQQKAPVITGTTSTWSLPDNYQYICDYGFLALALLHTDDPRLTMYNQKFMSALLGANRGLSEMEKNIFVGNWLALTRQETSEQMRTQQGVQARGV